ncbi:signal recognition particle-docking protein FtsY [Lactococcus formosensis subsp. formosensis]|uniref:signal recognition particle-docking protein FtsY n=1 Tax=Lactococcus formosensis TaxID=1281486 RepID=UPI0007CB975C|nr:signal recognition particle-docking protein FtsY [Lactococcus formosensis]BAV03414.1 Signal recognition particle receptor FtsY [Lactococcus formosensis]BDW49608.1 signal recognition particle receptor FtsY [Lactococcus formosensis]BDX25196.1 signal recognition particle receptor FtsY [Lactococcus formosensis]
MGLFDRLFGKKKETEEVPEEVVEVKEQPEVESEEITDDVAEAEEQVQNEPAEEALTETIPEIVAELRQETSAKEAEEKKEFQEESDILEEEIEEIEAAEVEELTPKEEVLDESETPVESKVQEEEISNIEEKYDKSLEKTRKTFGQRFNAFLANFRSVDEEFFEELEETLIMSDVGVDLALEVTEELRNEAKLANAKSQEALRQLIVEKIVDKFDDEKVPSELNLQNDLTVFLFVGVNGVGKTTTIGKLAHRYKNEGKKVLLAAADTFRAGAIDQLVEWGKRSDVPVVTKPAGSDPASVVFDAVDKAKKENFDILLIDTAGRLQNKDNLMKELEKIGKIIKRELPAAPHEVILALDATTGQNAIQQAKEFSAVTPITGIALTKLDGSAKGGIVLSIVQSLKIPVKFVGLGEGINDLTDFDEEFFVRGLFKELI